MFSKVVGFLKAHKGKILIAIVFIVGGLKAVGVDLPQSFVDTVTSVVSSF